LIEQQGFGSGTAIALVTACRTSRGGYGSVIGDIEMKRITLIAGLASVGAVAAVLWTVPVAAATECAVGCASHDARSGREERDRGFRNDDEETTSTSVPEPGTLALLGLGLSGLGLTGLGRKRTKK
jgi:hypothetical protein